MPNEYLKSRWNFVCRKENDHIFFSVQPLQLKGSKLMKSCQQFFLFQHNQLKATGSVFEVRCPSSDEIAVFQNTTFSLKTFYSYLLSFGLRPL